MPACQKVVVSCVVTNEAEVIMSDRTVGRGVILGLNQYQRVQLGSIYIAQQASYTTSSIDKCTSLPLLECIPEPFGHLCKCRRTKSGKLLPGPSFAVPLVGGVVEMVLNPFKFWEEQRKTSFPGASPVRFVHVPPGASQDMTSPWRCSWWLQDLLHGAQQPACRHPRC